MEDLPALARALSRSMYLNEDDVRQLMERVRGGAPATARELAPVRVAVNAEPDIVVARGAVKDLCESIGFDRLTVVKLTTVVSELARNIFHYAQHGWIVARCVQKPRIGIEIVARDEGPGIADINAVLSSSYCSLSSCRL